jgi:chemotaxis protein CheX
MKESSGEYRIVIDGETIVFTLECDLSKADAMNLVSDVRAAMAENSLKKILIDAQNQHLIDSLGIRTLGPFSAELKVVKCSIHIQNAPRELKMLIEELGMSSSLKLVDADPPTQSAPAPKGKSIDVGFVNPFIEGTINTLKVQCSLDCVAQKPQLKDATAKGTTYDIAGVIGLTSETFCGSIAICFPEKVFLGAMSNMLGEDCKAITKDLEDGAGELLNIIFGHAKRILNEKGYSLAKAIPTVIRGSALEIKHLTPSKTIILPFETKFGQFTIEIGTDTTPQTT